MKSILFFTSMLCIFLSSCVTLSGFDYEAGAKDMMEEVEIISGKSCTHTILYIISYGDASIYAAKEAAGLQGLKAKNITLDMETYSVSPFYVRHCMIMRAEVDKKEMASRKEKEKKAIEKKMKVRKKKVRKKKLRTQKPKRESGKKSELEGTCGDNEDNDNDGWIDRADPDCSGGNEENNRYGGFFECNDGIDNDNDGRIDTKDSNCKNARSSE